VSSGDRVLLDVTGGVATITLNDPGKRNAFGSQMGRDLAKAYATCDADEAVRAVILTGTPPAFCSGADMSEGAATFRSRDEATFSAAGVATPAWRVRKPVIAAVNGHAVGIGFTLTLQCDIRIFAADARYGVVQVRRGVMGDAFSHWTLPRLAGMSAAAEILLTGRTFGGPEMKEMGLCRLVLPNSEVLPAATELARDIAANTAPLAVALSKELLWRTWECGADQVGALETEYHHRLMAHPDAAEGVLAYLEHRRPRWLSRVEGRTDPPHRA
jgi:enoyl-CoA hydratase/carnithine racemase